MKLLHTSDWHLGKSLNNYSRHAEQQEVLQEICEIAESEKVNAVLIAGDLFDTYNPPTESVELFYRMLKRLSANGTRAVIAIAGNHDSPERIEAPDPLARECGIIFAGYPNSVVSPFALESGLRVSKSEEGFIILSLPGIAEPLRILLTPYANEFRLKTCLGYGDSEDELRKLLEEKWNQIAGIHCDEQGVNILLTHLLVMKKGDQVPDEPDDEKPILHVGGAQVIYTENIPHQIQYTALGHLHRKQKVGSSPGNVVYSGSPLSYSFSEADQKKFVVVTEILPGKQPVIKEIQLSMGLPLIRKRAESVEEAVDWLAANPKCLVELTMATETYLTASERKSLFTAHEGIVMLIPDVKNRSDWKNDSGDHIDLTKSIDDLFIEYFKHARGQAPNENLLNLLKEVLSETDQD
jgi:DNA repair protein SbcD/Mre11